MSTPNPKLVFLLAILFLALPVLANPEKLSLREGPKTLAAKDSNVGRLIPDLEFSPISGKKLRLTDYKSAPITVIAFTSTSCPVTKRYAPTLAALEKEYS